MNIMMCNERAIVFTCVTDVRDKRKKNRYYPNDNPHMVSTAPITKIFRHVKRGYNLGSLCNDGLDATPNYSTGHGRICEYIKATDGAAR